MWVDLDGDDVEDAGDQVTTYTFGTTKGASAGDSKIGTGHLLQKVAYPDSTGGSDVVTFAYDAQSQEIWTKDQDGTVFETDFDDAGRTTQRRVTTLAGGLDGAVRRIATAYDALGRVSTVTQYDNAAVGSGAVVDQAKYTYDDWGPIAKFEQDHDSAVGGTLLYDVDFAWEKATAGRNTIRRDSMNLPDGTQVNFDYLSTLDRHDHEASRVSILSVGSGFPVTVARYDYL
jgi:YD repeat-containing protein